MTQLKHAFLRKFGPLPAGAWLGIITGALLLYRHFKGGGAAATAATATTPATDTSGFGNGFGYGNSASGSGGGGLTAPTDQTALDNSTGGIGAPVVYDPATDQYTTDTSNPDAPTESAPSADAGNQLPAPSPPGSAAPVRPRAAVKSLPLPKPGQAPNYTDAHDRPATTRGQTKLRPRTPAAHTPVKAKPAARPAAKAHTAAVASPRAQAHVVTAITRPRSETVTAPAPPRVVQPAKKKKEAPRPTTSTLRALVKSAPLVARAAPSSPAAAPKPASVVARVASAVGVNVVTAPKSAPAPAPAPVHDTPPPAQVTQSRTVSQPVAAKPKPPPPPPPPPVRPRPPAPVSGYSQNSTAKQLH